MTGFVVQGHTFVFHGTGQSDRFKEINVLFLLFIIEGNMMNTLPLIFLPWSKNQILKTKQ